jgi:hypothetical protein
MNMATDLAGRFYERRTSSATRCSKWTPRESSRVRLGEAFQSSFKEDYWRHGIVISQGSGMSVSKDEAFRRLEIIVRHLLRRMFGNRWRKKGKANFVVFQHGSMQSGDAHFHALLGIDGHHSWSDFRIAMTIKSIELARHLRGAAPRWEKMAHVDWNWAKGNRYHSYVGRFANKRHDDWWVLQV